MPEPIRLDFLCEDPLPRARLAAERRYREGHTTSDLRVCTNPDCTRCGGLTEQMTQRAIGIPSGRGRAER